MEEEQPKKKRRLRLSQVLQRKCSGQRLKPEEVGWRLGEVQLVESFSEQQENGEVVVEDQPQHGPFGLFIFVYHFWPIIKIKLVEQSKHFRSAEQTVERRGGVQQAVGGVTEAETEPDERLHSGSLRQVLLLRLIGLLADPVEVPEEGEVVKGAEKIGKVLKLTITAFLFVF